MITGECDNQRGLCLRAHNLRAHESKIESRHLWMIGRIGSNRLCSTNIPWSFSIY